MLELIGFLAAVLIGISLGMIGGGGSILTVPVLTYLLGIDAVTSTSYSLFIVGGTALVGAYRAYVKGEVEIKIGIIFAIPSLTAVWLTRALLIPWIPDELLVTKDFILTKDLGIMIFFSIIMLVSSYSMIRNKSNEQPAVYSSGLTPRAGMIIVLEGLVVGTATGIVGAGGGFLIIPALVLLTGMPMKKAVGTSLMIITAKSLIGFTGDLTNPEITMDWTILLIFTSMSIIGIFIGTAIASKVSGRHLKRGFGWFLLVMGIYILADRLINMLG
ncbi:MAG: sulfite exporter TauE/SafE family protein [Vicingaceae bacterium]